MGHPREISRTILFDGFAGIEEYIFEDTERHEKFRRTVVTRPNAAAILLINREKQTVILVRQFRAPVYSREKDGLVLEVPAGLLEMNEIPEQTIIRETLEETGYKISNPFLINTFYPTVGVLNELIYLYGAYVSETDHVGTGGGLDEEHEFLDVVEMSYQQAFDACTQGIIKDGKTLVALYWLKANFLPVGNI